MLLLIILSFFLGTTLSNTSNAASFPIFAKKYQTLTIGKKVQYQIKNLKNSYSVFFSVSNSSLGSIHPKTGILYPKKSGKLIVKANIYNKKHQKLWTLKDSVKILEKNTILPNASFQIKETINPWNFTLTLSCNRILLEKEIKNSKLTIVPRGKKSPELKANFSKLSSNGKEITYTLEKSSQKKLCPGDYSMNGNYTLESSHFNKKLSLTYQERLTKNTLSGFVLQPDGSPVKKALLSLKTTTSNKQCSTDKNGHYILKNIADPISLTASKEGFQTTTIEKPFLSGQGVSCENIILRSQKDSAVSIEFLVTDTDNHPISDASVYILSNEENSNIKTEKSSVFSDLLSKENMITCQNTDASGNLIISNADLSEKFPAPCSNIIVNNSTQLSYNSSYRPTSNHCVTLSPNQLNTTDQYLIYVNKPTFNPTSPSYYAQKLSFSFSSLSTNHAYFHIQLSECPNTCFQSLSLISEDTVSLSSCDSLYLRLFYPNQCESFFQYQINQDSFQYKESQLFIPYLQLPIALLDGTYYLQIQAYSEDCTLLGETCILPASIKNPAFQLKEISLKFPRYARILTYGLFEEKLPQMASFSLYQKSDTHYFLIDTFSTDIFTTSENKISTSQLLLSHLLSDQSYLLVSTPNDVMAKETFSFTANQQNTFLTKKEAAYSSVPLTQILCVDTNSLDTSDFSSIYSDETITISYSFFHKITPDFVRSCDTYPNCVLAFYHTNGTLLTITLTTKPSQSNILFQTDSSDRKSSIIDIYTNKEILITNQDSYQ